jgi:hypothetical protein
MIKSMYERFPAFVNLYSRKYGVFERKSDPKSIRDVKEGSIRIGSFFAMHFIGILCE